MAHEHTVAKRYARALFRLASSRAELEGTLKELAVATEALASEAATIEFWASPVHDAAEKKRVLDGALERLGDALGQLTGNLVRVLFKNGRLALLPAVAGSFSEMAEAAAGRIGVEVKTAMALEESHLAALKERLGEALGGEVILAVKEDPSLLGGIVVKVEDTVYDASAAGRLERFMGRLAPGQ